MEYQDLNEKLSVEAKKMGKYLDTIEKSNIFNNEEFNTFIELFNKIFRFREYYFYNCMKYFEKGKTICINNDNYRCNDCPIALLMPWRADGDIRCCPTGKRLEYGDGWIPANDENFMNNLRKTFLEIL